jgi:hypothetical protein
MKNLKIISSRIRGIIWQFKFFMRPEVKTPLTKRQVINFSEMGRK